MRRKDKEFGNNRGLVKAIVMLHGERGRIRVKVSDEDETESYWIDTPSRTAGANRDYDMPPLGTEIWAMMDAKGEDGLMVSARHNSVDNEPTNDPNMRVSDGPWGSFHLNKETGVLDINLSTLNLNIDTIIINGQRIEHNGKNIGHDHTHGGITRGGANTDEPNP